MASGTIGLKSEIRIADYPPPYSYQIPFTHEPLYFICIIIVCMESSNHNVFLAPNPKY